MTYWSVSPALRGLIDDIYVFRSTGPAYRGLAGALLPQAQWLLAGQFSWQARNGAVQPIPDAAGLGPSAAALHLETQGDTVVVGFGFYPEGWSAMMPVPAGSVIEQVLDLPALWPDSDVQRLVQLDPRESDAALASAIDSHVLTRLSYAAAIDDRIPIISEWANGAEHDLPTLLSRLRVSQRQAQRLTTAAHGLAPRHLANKHKTLRVAAALSTGQIKYNSDIWASEFTDQPHFINNFKRYIGTTPTRFLHEPNLLVREVMRARFSIDAPHPLSLGPSQVRSEPTELTSPYFLRQHH